MRKRLAILGSAILLGLSACTAGSSIKEATGPILDRLDRIETSIEARRDQVEDGSDEAARLDELAAEVEAVRLATQTARDAGLAVSGQAEPTGFGEMIASIIPGPAGIAIGSLVGIGFGLWRERKAVRAAIDALSGIDKARAAIPEFDTAFDAAKRTIAASQTPEARKLVQKAKGRS